MAPRINHRDRYNSRRHIKTVIKINESCRRSPAAWSRKDRLHRVRTLGKKLNIPKLVYKFLGNVASLEAAGSHGGAPTTHKEFKHHRRAKKLKKHHRRIRSSSSRAPTKGNQDLRSFVTCARGGEKNSTIRTTPSTPASTTSGIGTGKKFSIQTIKDYIKAGIAEGKRRAKKYMCKALSFGVDTGYLIPTDADGQVLRVSSALVSFTAQKDDGERGLRQKLRRGDANCTAEERRLLRRRSAVVSRKRTRSSSSVPSSASASKRSRPKAKKPKYSKKIRKHRARRSRTKSKRQPGKPRGRVRPSKIRTEKLNPNLEGPESGIDDACSAEENLGKKALTASRSEEDKVKSIKEEKLSDPSIEGNSSEMVELKEK